MPIKSVRSLARRLGRSEEQLRSLAVRAPQAYRDGALLKPDGTYRPIRKPSRKLKSLQRHLLERIIRQEIRASSSVDSSERGHVRAAKKHQGANWVGAVDIRGFFGNVSHREVYKIFERYGFSPDCASLLARLVTLDGGCRRGRQPPPPYRG